MGPVIGQGAFAKVRQAKHKESGMIVAIKVYEKKKVDSDPTFTIQVEKEIRILSCLSNIQMPSNEKRNTYEISTNYDEVCIPL